MWNLFVWALEKWAFDKPFGDICQRMLINHILTDNVGLLCLSYKHTLLSWNLYLIGYSKRKSSSLNNITPTPVPIKELFPLWYNYLCCNSFLRNKVFSLYLFQTYNYWYSNLTSFFIILVESASIPFSACFCSCSEWSCNKTLCSSFSTKALEDFSSIWLDLMSTTCA